MFLFHEHSWALNTMYDSKTHLKGDTEIAMSSCG